MFKRDLSSPSNIFRTVISFANTAGGTLIIKLIFVIIYFGNNGND